MVTKNLLTTSDLIAVLLSYPNQCVEARLVINQYRATYFLYYAKQTLFDEGIDGEETKRTLTDFCNLYKDEWWIFGECSIKCVIVLDDDVIPDTVFKQNRQLLERGRPIL